MFGPLVKANLRIMLLEGLNNEITNTVNGTKIILNQGADGGGGGGVTDTIYILYFI